MSARDGELGSRIIATYKLVKGVGQLGLALGLAISVATGGVNTASLAMMLRHHFSEAWSVHLAALLTLRHIELTGLALLLDGVLSLIEGRALRAGRWWAPWLVVIATSAFVPFELVALVRNPHWPRLLALVVNAAIVAYFARRAWREHVAKRPGTV